MGARTNENDVRFIECDKTKRLSGEWNPPPPPTIGVISSRDFLVGRDSPRDDIRETLDTHANLHNDVS